MLKLNYQEILFIGLVFEGFLYGLYSGIFAMYLRYQASKKETDKKQNIVFYSICVLYVLTAALFVAHITASTSQLPRLHHYFIGITLFGCCDFIAQFILIYRCWIVWGCNIRVVTIPSLLAFAFLGQSAIFFDWLVSISLPLVTWLVGGSSSSISSGKLQTPIWGYWMNQSGLALSLIVNTLVTGLIVFRIFRVFREVGTTSNDQILGTTGGSKFRSTVLVLIESGLALFFIQLTRIVVTIVDTDAAVTVLPIVTSIHNMFNGITPTIILVRISMGLSFHDEKSMEEVAIGSLRFASNHSNSIQETGSINIVGQDNRDDDSIGVQRSNDIEIVER